MYSMQNSIFLSAKLFLYVKKMPMALTFASLNLTNGPSSFQQPFEIESRGSDPPSPRPHATSRPNLHMKISRAIDRAKLNLILEISVIKC